MNRIAELSYRVRVANFLVGDHGVITEGYITLPMTRQVVGDKGADRR